MDLFDLVVAKKLSGGGGSSDFSIANVTITNTDGLEKICIPWCISDDEEEPEMGSYLFPQIVFPEIETSSFQIALFKGKAIATTTIGPDDLFSIFKSVSGSAQLVDSEMVIITGDCSITIGKQGQ